MSSFPHPAFGIFARTIARSSPSISLRFSSSISARALTFEKAERPVATLKTVSYTLPPPPSDHVRVKFYMGVINPADINVLQGVYPSKPELRTDLIKGSGTGIYIPGNEGLGVVESIGENVSGIKPGNWVIMGKPQLGTWSSHANLPADAIIKVPNFRGSHITQIQAATLGVNPATAYRLISDFADIKPGDCIIQNGANSAVGKAVIQIAKAKKIKTINLFRDREDPKANERMISNLKLLGGDAALTYDMFEDRSRKKEIQDSIFGSERGHIKLALNCIGGQSVTEMIKILDQDGTVVTYGGMRFWMTEWYRTCSETQRFEMIKELVDMIGNHQLDVLDAEIIELAGSDGQTETLANNAIRASLEGGNRKKIFKFI